MHQHGYIGRKLRIPKLEKDPAIIITAFGTSSRATLPLEEFNTALKKEFPNHAIFWGYTSEILCKKMDLPSLKESLAKAESTGYRKAVVQPLHIFPGTEYQQLAETCEYFPGMRIFLGETLLHRWAFIKQMITVVEQDFLQPEQGLNLVVLHGTPLAADPANIIYLGLERLLLDMYPNVITASLEGIPDREAVFAAIRQRNLSARHKNIKIIPLMYLAGWHAKKDLMGESNSWRVELEQMGFKVECAMAQHGDEEFFKGLAYYPETTGFFMERLKRSLKLAKVY